MIVFIKFLRTTLRVRITHPEADLEPEAATVSPVQAFIRDFNEQAARVRAPKRGLQSEDYGIALRLLSKYGHDKLVEYAQIFWHRYSQPIFDDPNAHVMRIFAARIADLEKEIQHG